MTTENRRLGGEGDHRDGVTDDKPEPIRRAAATWAQRHRARLDRIFAGRDPWLDYDRRTAWTDSELRAWERTAGYLRGEGLFGRWQVPESARAAWRCRSCPCNRDAA
jgi:hypothetical protein